MLTSMRAKHLRALIFLLQPIPRRALIRELGTCRFIQRAENVFFLGPTGDGGRLIWLSALTRCLPTLPHRGVLQVPRTDRESLTKADLTASTERLLKSLSRCDLLVIDEFAMRKLDARSAEWVYTIVDNRYGSASTILTSNRSLEDWLAVFPDKVMANAVMDRLAQRSSDRSSKANPTARKRD
ncbi:MAG: ATP-binding protein [Ignavibacteriae bacterium]|nr:ATP-binding protein [Ignavibacteriota bacterium]